MISILQKKRQIIAWEIIKQYQAGIMADIKYMH